MNSFLVICLVWILFIMLSKYHVSFVYFCYFVSCMCIHVDVYTFMYESFNYVRVSVLIYFWCFVHTYIYICIYIFLIF